MEFEEYIDIALRDICVFYPVIHTTHCEGTGSAVVLNAATR